MYQPLKQHKKNSKFNNSLSARVLPGETAQSSQSLVNE